MASTKDKNGEHVEKNIPQDGGGFDYRTLKQITDIHQKQKAGGDPFEGYTAETLQKITVDGKPVYVDIETDPDTGKIINARISDEAQAHIDELAQHIAGISKSLTDAIPPETIKKMQQNIKSATEGIKRIINSFNTEKWRTFADEFIKEYQPKSDLLHEFYDELEPFIKKELEKPEYNGITFDGLLDQYDNISVFYDEANNPDSLLYKVYHAAKDAKAAHDAKIAAQQAGREARKETKENAKQTNAIMKLRGGNYSIFSQANLWNAFTPGRIVKMGEPIKKYIDEKTGKVNKMRFEPGDIEMIKDPGEISLQAFTLLNSIINNSVDDPRKTPIEETEFYKNDGKLRFYVKGVIDAIKNDPRTLIKIQDGTDSQQLDINRKTAGAIYLEQLFEPLQGYIGTTSNGSRWSVFNYVGYDAETDTMTVQTPYLYQLWHETQAPYFIRKKNKEAQQLAGKKPKAADEKPLELNNLFKGAAYNEDEAILEIAVYITNVLLTAGNKGKAKTTRIKYNTIISNCPRLKARINNLQELPAKYTDENGKEHTRNKSALYNTELRKIARAFDIIQNPDECDAREKYDFIDISPATKDKNAGTFKLTPPTKSMLQEQIVIVWRKTKDDESPQ